jgi:hypothetical protein
LDSNAKQQISELLPVLLEAFKLESDRGVVLVVAAMVEHELEKQIELRLLPKIEATDELMSQSVMSPIGSFSAKINIAYRIGIITAPERKIFHQLRAIRNCCAHEIDSQTFEANHFRDRIKNIVEAAPDLWAAIQEKIKPVPYDKQAFQSIDDYLDTIGWRILFEFFFAMIIAFKRSSRPRVSRILALSDEA